jgi:hypothetical protein
MDDQLLMVQLRGHAAKTEIAKGVTDIERTVVSGVHATGTDQGPPCSGQRFAQLRKRPGDLCARYQVWK